MLTRFFRYYDKLTHSNRACKSRGLVFILKTSGALRLSLRYFNTETPIQKVKPALEDVADEQFAELSKKNHWCCEPKEPWTELNSRADADPTHAHAIGDAQGRVSKHHTIAHAAPSRTQPDRPHGMPHNTSQHSHPPHQAPLQHTFHMKWTRRKRIAPASQSDDYSDNLLESSLYHYDYVYVYQSMHMIWLCLCLWLWLWGYGGHAYGPMAMPMALWISLWRLCIWPYAYGPVPIAIPMAVAMPMPIVYGACIDKT